MSAADEADRALDAAGHAGGDITGTARRSRLAFAHLGDLHIAGPRQQNAVDLLSIVSQIEIECAHALDFVVLPGDNADDGLPAQYAFVATALRMLSVPVHAITGDHDMAGGGLDAFRAGLAPARLPRSVRVGGVTCLFLDMSGPGTGGPDFRLGAEQLAWLEAALRAADDEGATVALFMHTYPEDLSDPAEAASLTRLIAAHGVALVDMGHTHYNELAHDGRTIFAATRSTGQIEEGPVGYALTTIEDGVVSWRFKLLDEPFPFVMITSPADHRLVRGAGQIATDGCEVRARVFGSHPPARVDRRVDDGPWVPLTVRDGTWCGRLDVPGEPLFSLAVRAIDSRGRPGLHGIRPAGPGFRPRPEDPVGSDAASIGAWPENGIAGTQLGPNRNARPPGGASS